MEVLVSFVPPEPRGNTVWPAERPLLVYDGDCGFCRRWIVRWKAATGGAIDYEPYQAVAGRFPEIPAGAFHRSVQLIEPSGRVTPAAHGVFRTFALAGRRRGLLWAYEHVPGVAVVAEGAYRFVAGHREGFGVLDRWMLGKDPAPPTYAFVRWLFLRALAVVALIAFVSIWVQVDGLVGERGISSAGRFFAAVRQALGYVAWERVPSLMWVRGDDAMLHWLCGGGTACSLLLLLDVAPAVCLVGIYTAYLSLLHACQEFLGFQWDVLLLETVVLAVFFAPWGLWTWGAKRKGVDAPRVPLFLLWWLLFRLMLMSGLVKFAGEDRTWRGWVAMTYHYLTQPLPPWTAWYMHHLPKWFHVMTCGVVFFVEMVSPFLILMPRVPRRVAFWVMALFQVGLIATGNYGFFNLLAIVLCIPLTDDLFWPEKVRRACGFGRVPVRATGVGASVRRWASVALLLFLLPITAARLVFSGGWHPEWAVAVREWYQPVDPFAISNSYGLFANMTTERPEIIVEGSDDGVTWKAYGFKYKPGELARRPAFVVGHMPRLDWMMWFAALGGDYRASPWTVGFFRRLLEGSPEVLGLLRHNPFPGRPPKYVRAEVYDYRFTTGEDRAATGEWWTRRREGVFCPVISLESFGERER